MDKAGWSLILEESRTTIEHLRPYVSALSDFSARSNQRLEEHARSINESAARVVDTRRKIEESQQLLESVRELRERLEGLMCKAVDLDELASSGLVLAEQQGKPENGKHRA